MLPIRAPILGCRIQVIDHTFRELQRRKISVQCKKMWNFNKLFMQFILNTTELKLMSRFHRTKRCLEFTSSRSKKKQNDWLFRKTTCCHQFTWFLWTISHSTINLIHFKYSLYRVISVKDIIGYNKLVTKISINYRDSSLLRMILNWSRLEKLSTTCFILN